MSTLAIAAPPSSKSSFREVWLVTIGHSLTHWYPATFYLLLPLIGPEAFTTWSQWAKYAHNYLSFPFTIGVFVIFLMWIAWNVPNRVDVEWLKEGGGMVGHKHPPAYRFNAGQKMIYWIVVLGGAAVAVSGYLLMFPFYTTDVTGMQLAEREPETGLAVGQDFCIPRRGSSSFCGHTWVVPGVAALRKCNTKATSEVRGSPYLSVGWGK